MVRKNPLYDLLLDVILWNTEPKMAYIDYVLDIQTLFEALD
jgi:hypothetical protein